MQIGSFCICLLMGYVLGSINFSLVIGRFYGIDIREHGSGNAGMTNTLRTLGKLPAALVIVGDMAKGILACILGALILDEFYGFQQAGLLAAGFGALLGHNWPVFFQFKGGKGVLTTFSVILMMNVKLGLILLVVFLFLVAIFRYISLGSVVAAGAFPMLSWVLQERLKTDVLFTGFAFLVACIVIIKHRENISRLKQGQERKLSFSKK